MRYILMFNHKGWWKQIDRSNDYDKLMAKTELIDDATEWQIVELKRYHSGSEKFELNGDDPTPTTQP